MFTLACALVSPAFATMAATLLQEAQRGPSGLVWLLIFLVIVFVTGWLLIRSARQSDQSPYLKGHEPKSGHEPAPAGHEHPADAASPEPVVTATVVTERLAETPAVPFGLPVDPAVEVKPDDLIIIEGIGPKINALLNEAGIRTFADLAAADPRRLSELLRQARMAMADPASWPEQASLAVAGDWEGLKALQERLKGGRK